MKNKWAGNRILSPFHFVLSAWQDKSMWREMRVGIWWAIVRIVQKVEMFNVLIKCERTFLKLIIYEPVNSLKFLCFYLNLDLFKLAKGWIRHQKWSPRYNQKYSIHHGRTRNIFCSLDSTYGILDAALRLEWYSFSVWG